MDDFEEALALEVRRKIYEEIKASPGLHFRELQRRVGLATGSLQYHLDYLAKYKAVDKVVLACGHVIDIVRGAPFHVVIEQLALQFGNINPYVTAVGVITLATGILAKKFIPKLPYMIVAMVVGSIVAFFINAEFDVAVTQIKTVGALPASLPPFSLPDFFSNLKHCQLTLADDNHVNILVS